MRRFWWRNGCRNASNRQQQPFQKHGYRHNTRNGQEIERLKETPSANWKVELKTREQKCLSFLLVSSFLLLSSSVFFFFSFPLVSEKGAVPATICCLMTYRVIFFFSYRLLSSFFLVSYFFQRIFSSFFGNRSMSVVYTCILVTYIRIWTRLCMWNIIECELQGFGFGQANTVFHIQHVG